MTITRFELGIYRNETRNFIAHDDPIPTMETNKASTHFHFAWDNNFDVIADKTLRINGESVIH